MSKPNTGLFIRFNIITIIAVYFLILVGGIVRSTGSGMGCPDWPKCFGEYVPPMEASELPDNYKEIYLNKRVEKNQRLSKMFEALGLNDLSKRIREDKSILIEEDFNMTKTWIEYINRLVGVIIGLLIIACLVSSLTFWGHQSSIVYLSFASVVLVIFQGWVGSIVVSTNLLPGMITVHMVLAIALIMLLLYTRFRVIRPSLKGIINYKAYKLRRLMVICMILFLAQLLLGTQIREAIDQIAMKLGEDMRGEWIESLGLTFYIHRSYSVILLFLHLYLAYQLLKSTQGFKESKLMVLGLVGMIVLEILSGAIMGYFSVPRFAQPIHLLLAVMIFGVQYYLYLLIRERSKDRLALING